MRETEGVSQLMVDESHRPVEQLPDVHQALAEGLLSPRHVRVVLGVVRDYELRACQLDPPMKGDDWCALLQRFAARLLPLVKDKDPAELRRCARRQLDRLLPDLPAAEHVAKARERGVTHWPGDALDSVAASLTPVDALMAVGCLDVLAQAPGLPLPVGVAACGATRDDRTADAARADALLYALRHAASCPGALHELHAVGEPGQEAASADGVLPLEAAEGTGRPPRRRGVRRPRLQVDVVIDLPTLMGLAENPAELRGHGPLPGRLARILAGDAEWRRFVTEPVEGHLLDLGRTSYQPTQRLREFLLARDPVCRAPHGSRRANRDLDHCPPWNQGGRTSAATMCAVCRHDHNQKTHGELTIQMRPDGVATFTTPLGRTVESPPPPQLPP